MLKDPTLQKTITKPNILGQALNIQNTDIHLNSTQVVHSKLSEEFLSITVQYCMYLSSSDF